MSDNRWNGKCYESTGTIHLRIQTVAAKSEGHGQATEKPEGEGTAYSDEIVYFSPDDSHWVTHEGRRYAVFLPVRSRKAGCSCQSQCSCQAAKAKFVKAIAARICEPANSVELRLCDTSNAKLNSALMEAALKQAKVDVTVCVRKSDGNCPTLTGITVPARQSAR